ncbi:hypothetical protein N7467_010812 [Penicillium canescens]|nr:hypothetical protein N7467_010812 [Penicillium canescens]
MPLAGAPEQPTRSTAIQYSAPSQPLMAHRIPHKRLMVHQSTRGTAECSTVDLVQARPCYPRPLCALL